MDYGNLDGEIDENRLDKSLGCWVPKIKHREFAGDVQYKWIYIYCKWEISGCPNFWPFRIG
jgi:hypothetical protein